MTPPTTGFDEQAFRRGLQSERLKPDDVVSFLNALPRRIRTVLDTIEDEQRRAAEAQRVDAIVDRLGELITEVKGEGYPLEPHLTLESDLGASADAGRFQSDPTHEDPVLAELADTDYHIEGAALERLESAVAEATQRLAGLPPDALSEDHEDSVMGAARQAVSDLAVMLRSLTDAAVADPGVAADHLDPLAAPIRTEKADNAEVIPAPDRAATIEQARDVAENLKHSQHRPPVDQQIIPGTDL